MIKKILFLSLLLLATYQTSLENTSLVCTEAQLSGGYINIVLGGTNQCIALSCLNQQPYLATDIDQSDLISFTSEFENVEVQLTSLEAFCPSSNASCLTDSCIEFSVKHSDNTPITASNSGSMVENFTFELPLTDLKDTGKCTYNSVQREYTCNITVEYNVKGLTGADVNSQAVQFKIAEQTRNLVEVAFDTPFVIVECVGGTGSCEGGDDGSDDLTFISTCAGPISNLEGNVGFSLEYLQNVSSQYYYKFFVEYNNPYVHNPDCLDQVVTFNDKVIETGEAEFDQLSFDQPTMKSSYSVSKENMETYGCKKTVNEDGSISYDCSLKVEFFTKDTTSLQYTYMSNQQMTVSSDETALNSVGIETITLSDYDQVLVICDNFACDNELSPPFSYFLNETIYVKQTMRDPSQLSKYLDVQSVKIAGKEVEISEKDGSVAGSVRYGFLATEASSSSQELEVISKVRDTAPSTRLLSVVPTVSVSFAIKSDIQISELKEVPVPTPPTEPPANPDGGDGDDDDNTALIVILVLVSLLLIVAILLGVFKYLQSKGKFGGNNEIRVIPENTEQNKGVCDTNANQKLVEVEGEQQIQSPKDQVKETEIQATKTELENEQNEQNEQIEQNEINEPNEENEEKV